MQRSLWLVCLIVATGAAPAQETQRSVLLETTVPKPCVSLMNRDGISVVLSRRLLVALSAERPPVTSQLPRSADSERAERLLQRAHGQGDRFGCAPAAFPTDDGIYLVARLVGSGRAVVFAAGSQAPEKSVDYVETNCDDRNPAGFLSIYLDDGSPLVLMLQTCIAQESVDHGMDYVAFALPGSSESLESAANNSINSARASREVCRSATSSS